MAEATVLLVSIKSVACDTCAISHVTVHTPPQRSGLSPGAPLGPDQTPLCREFPQVVCREWQEGVETWSSVLRKPEGGILDQEPASCANLTLDNYLILVFLPVKWRDVSPPYIPTDSHEDHWGNSCKRALMNGCRTVFSSLSTRGWSLTSPPRPSLPSCTWAETTSMESLEALWMQPWLFPEPSCPQVQSRNEWMVPQGQAFSFPPQVQGKSRYFHRSK